MNKEQLKKAFSDAIAWGFVYGPALSAQDFNELRDKNSEQLVEEIIKNALWLDPYRVAVDSEMVNTGIGVSSGDAQADLYSIIDWHVDVALDPAVSERAKKLVEEGSS